MSSNEKNIPKRRFKEFLEGEAWEERKLYQVAEFNPKADLPDVFEYVDLESVVGTEMISHRTTMKSSAPSRAQRLAMTGDVFYQTVRPYQKNNYLFIKPDRNYVFSTGYAQMRPNIEADFLMGFLQTESFVKTVLDNCTGTSYPAINSTDLSNLQIYLPVLRDEQKRVGRMFTKLDNLITLHQRKLDKLKVLKKAYLAQMFPSVGESKPRLRFSGFNDDWEQRKLGELGSVVMNKRIFKEQTSDVGEVPFYKIGTFGSEPDAFISRELFEEYKSKYPYPEKGDILISASGSIGRTVEYKGEDEYFQDSNIVWLQHDSRLINSFLKQFYSIVKWSGLEGSTIKRLYNKNILDTKILLPKPAEQKKIGEFFIELDNLITLHQRKLEKLQNIKKAYLNEMFV
ncbi:restriction endonuclease subunit S [uncultured Clostridium sp.]|uniref:restriction endonuclease subunit S n=1 Tax=uncultured Clostridium sp. TaxID=59620 RepID=UPI0025E7B822|nr:restriction endonuclease subunit S [uncultured Clostridium sp.]